MTLTVKYTRIHECPTCHKNPEMLVAVHSEDSTTNGHIHVTLECKNCNEKFMQSYPYNGDDKDIARAEECAIYAWNWWAGTVAVSKCKHLSACWDMVKLRDQLTELGILWFDRSTESSYALDDNDTLVMLRTQWKIDGGRVSVIWGYYAKQDGYAKERYGVTEGFPDYLEVLCEDVDTDPMIMTADDIIKYMTKDIEQAKKFVPYYQREEDGQ